MVTQNCGFAAWYRDDCWGGDQMLYLASLYFFRGNGDNQGGGSPVGTPHCEVELMTRPVTFTKFGVSLSPGTHSFLEIFDSSGETTIEGGPTNLNNYRNPGLLRSFVTVDGFHYADDEGATSDGSFAISCDQAGLATYDGLNFTTTARYSGIFGPNSNSFLHWLINVSGLGGLFTNAPPGSWGWYDSVDPSVAPPGLPGPGKGNLPKPIQPIRVSTGGSAY